MSTRKIAVFVAVAALAAASGCGFLKKKEPPPADSAPPPASAAPIAESDVPTSEDFEDEAFTKITAANAASEFAELKKAIDAK